MRPVKNCQSTSLIFFFFFLPAKTDRSEEINKHKDQVFLKSIDVEFGEKFDPSMLDSNNPKREKLEKLF